MKLNLNFGMHKIYVYRKVFRDEAGKIQVHDDPSNRVDMYGKNEEDPFDLTAQKNASIGVSLFEELEASILTGQTEESERLRKEMKDKGFSPKISMERIPPQEKEIYRKHWTDRIKRLKAAKKFREYAKQVDLNVLELGDVEAGDFKDRFVILCKKCGSTKVNFYGGSHTVGYYNECDHKSSVIKCLDCGNAISWGGD